MKAIFIALCGASVLSFPAIAAMPQQGCHREVKPCQHTSPIPYLSGGIGEDARESIKAQEKHFNVKLIFAEKTGAYLADVNVVIADDSGNRILDIKADGPITLVQLPAGTFDIRVSAYGKTQIRHIAMRKDGRKTLTFLWQPE